MATVLDLITSALTSSSILATGENASAAEANTGLMLLNELMEEFTLEGLIVYSSDRLVFPLISGQQIYTIGTGGNFNTSRPFSINYANIMRYNNEYPITVLKTPYEWQSINANIHDINNNLIVAAPHTIYISGDYPLDKIHVYPTPTDNQSSLVLYIDKALSTFSNLTTILSLPPGYFSALRYNLAKRLCIDFGINITPELAQAAIKSLNNIRRINNQSHILDIPVNLYKFNYRRR